jgi:hypothetical protein
MTTDPNDVSQQDVDNTNADRANDGDPPVTAQDIQDVRDQMPDEE